MTLEKYFPLEPSEIPTVIRADGQIQFITGKRLGKGGFASVYTALQMCNGELIALKESPHDDKKQSTLSREAKLVSRFHHPNIPKFIAHVDSAERIVSPHLKFHYIYDYMATALVEGQNLKEHLKSWGEASGHERLSFAIKLGTAVANILTDLSNQYGVLYRDLTPHNILIGNKGDILLTDFGLLDEVYDSEHGGTAGTPRYMAPEAVVNYHNHTPQSLVYSLGVILYEVLTGSSPYGDIPTQSPLNTTAKNAYYLSMMGLPTPLSQHPLSKKLYSPQTLKDLESIQNRAINTIADQRFSTPLNYAAALNGLKSR